MTDKPADLADTLTITLRKPLTEGAGGEARTITSLEFREPTGAEMKEAEAGGTNSISITIKAIARVGGVAEATVRALGARDMMRAGDYLAMFVTQAVEPYDLKTLPDELEFSLRRPLEALGETHSSLRLREPTSGQLEAYDGLTGYGRAIKAVSLVAALPETAVGKIGVRDLNQMEAYLDAFLSDAPPAGNSD